RSYRPDTTPMPPRTVISAAWTGPANRPSIPTRPTTAIGHLFINVLLSSCPLNHPCGAKLLQSQQLRRIHFRHPVDIGDGTALTREVLIHRQQPIGMKGVVGLSEVARENNELGTDGANCFHVGHSSIRASAH